MTESFKDYPPSITELRSDQLSDASKWTPRDAAISVLRVIDSGEKIDAVCIAYRIKNDDGSVITKFATAAPDPHVALGLCMAAIQDMRA